MATKSNKYTSSKPKRDIYQEITDRVVAMLEQQIEAPTQRPWISLGGDSGGARNPHTKAYYRGINQLMLSMEMLGNNHLLNRWMSYNQARDAGGQVRKGSKATPVVFYKALRIDAQNRKYSEEAFNNMSATQRQAIGLRKVPMLKYSSVFNVAVIDGLPDEYTEAEPQEPLTDMQKNDRAEDLMERATKKMGVKLTIKESNRAFFSPRNNEIVMPLRSQFRGVGERYYAVSQHELIHSTAPKLGRDLKNAFGSPEYAKEEIIAELGSAFNCAALGVEISITEQVSYIQSWLKVLKSSKKVFFSAAAAAQRASDFILDGTPYQIRPDMP